MTGMALILIVISHAQWMIVVLWVVLVCLPDCDHCWVLDVLEWWLPEWFHVVPSCPYLAMDVPIGFPLWGPLPCCLHGESRPVTCGVPHRISVPIGWPLCNMRHRLASDTWRSWEKRLRGSFHTGAVVETKYVLPMMDTHIRGTYSRFAPNQWETSLLSNAVSHWLGTSLESDHTHGLHWRYCDHAKLCWNTMNRSLMHYCWWY